MTNAAFNLQQLPLTLKEKHVPLPNSILKIMALQQTWSLLIPLKFPPFPQISRCTALEKVPKLLCLRVTRCAQQQKSVHFSWHLRKLQMSPPGGLQYIDFQVKNLMLFRIIWNVPSSTPFQKDFRPLSANTYNCREKRFMEQSRAAVKIDKSNAE